MVNTLIPFKRLDNMLDSMLNSSLTIHPNWWNGQEVSSVPRADILEGDKDYQIRLDLPGVDSKALEINVENQTLTIQASREFPVAEEYKALRRELPGKVVMKRSFNLGNEIDADHISAKLEHGVLTLTLPKSDKALPRRIEVK